MNKKFIERLPRLVLFFSACHSIINFQLHFVHADQNGLVEEIDDNGSGSDVMSSGNHDVVRADGKYTIKKVEKSGGSCFEQTKRKCNYLCPGDYEKCRVASVEVHEEGARGNEKSQPRWCKCPDGTQPKFGKKGTGTCYDINHDKLSPQENSTYLQLKFEICRRVTKLYEPQEAKDDPSKAYIPFYCSGFFQYGTNINDQENYQVNLCLGV